MRDVRSVDQRLTEAAPVDLTAAHEQFARGMRELADALYAAFPVRLHPRCEPYREYTDPRGLMRGSIAAYTGDALDWVIDSWIGSPATGFSNHHLTIWLPPSVRVPHLAFAIGTIPHMFCFVDLVPRADLWVDTEQLDRYHAAFNDVHMAAAADPRFEPFVSREPYIRGAISPIGLCKTCDPTPDNIDHVLGLFRRFLDTWIGWVNDAPPVPEAERGALAARDALVRRTICERDPANIVAEKVLGARVTRELVSLLAGIGKDDPR